MESESNHTRKEYIKRINIILDFIDKHLESNLSLEVLSQKAHYSRYHFHRVFSIVVGENLNQYVNRKRIERIASILLTGTKQSIKELAYTYGFNSESSFSRAFKKYYGISPTSFKTKGKTILSKIGIDVFSTEQYISSIDHIKKWMEMNAQMIVMELQEIALAGIMQIGEFDKIEGLYQKLMVWGQQKAVLPTSGFKAITIYHDNPNVTSLAKVRYSACVTIDKPIEADGEIRPLSIQKGGYVVGRFEIKGEDISKAWKNSCVWVIENGYKFRDGDYFEIYHNDPKTHPDQKFILDICIPIEKTNSLELDQSTATTLSSLKEQGHPPLGYHELINYMKALRGFFHKEYEAYFKLGNVYQGHSDFSYFSLTTAELQKQKLKFVIILNHKTLSFSICLSGQNKRIRKKYWTLFKYSDWKKYHLAESIDDSLSIIDHTIVEDPDFEDSNLLNEQIETASLKFINELREVLE